MIRPAAKRRPEAHLYVIPAAWTSALPDNETARSRRTGAINNSRASDVVLDLFLASGTMLVAYERTGRTWYAMEIAPVMSTLR